MLKNFFLAFCFTLWGSFAFAQSPYGRVLTLDNNGTQQWIDIGTVLANYSTYHPGLPSPAWLTNGNNILGTAFLGTTNNQPLIFKTNNTETMRLTETGNLGIGTTNPLEKLDVAGNVRFTGALMPNGIAGTSGYVLVSQGSSNPPQWVLLSSIETDPVYSSWINATGSTTNQILRYNGTKYVPTSTGNLGTSTTGVTITNGSNAVIGSGTTIDIAAASGTTTGLLSSTDWTTFNNKLSSTLNSGYIFVGNASNVATGVALSGDATISNTGAITVTGLQSRSVANTSPSDGQVLTWNNSTTQWEPQTPSSDWSLSGNLLTGNEKLGSTNNQPVVVITNNTDRFSFTSKGQIEVLNSARSVFIGEGAGASQNNSSYRYNVFVGYQAGNSNTTGNYNTASGYQGLYSNTTGNYNTASGYQGLYSNTTGNYNTASGVLSLYYNTTGGANTASGVLSLYYNTTGSYNTASGVEALYFNTTGQHNTASGADALFSDTTGSYNTASGAYALYSNTTGNDNTAIGYGAGSNLTTGSNNILIGYNAQPSSATVSNEVTIGNSGNTSYRMYAASWTNASDARYKHDIADLPYGLDFILKLRPRQFVYNNSTDNKVTMGFIAQEVQQVLKQYDMQDKYNLVKIMEKDFLGLNTTEIIPVLVKAVQELSSENEELKKENAELKSRLEQFSDENEALKSRVERLEKIVLQGGAPENTNLGSTK
jgi:hypothetical protein